MTYEEAKAHSKHSGAWVRRKAWAPAIMFNWQLADDTNVPLRFSAGSLMVHALAASSDEDRLATDWEVTAPPSMEAWAAAQGSKDELVNHPSHYNRNGIEVLDVIEAYELDYHLGNVIKYILRAKYKGNEEQDLKKAQFYLNRWFEKRGSGQ